MQTSQQLSKVKIICRASFNQRVAGGLVFLAIAALFGFFWLAATDKIDIDRWLDPCGFKQRYALPCPTCGMTTSALAFVRGKIFESFYVQPAGALMCCMLVVIAFFAFVTGVFGIYFEFLRRFFAEIKIRYIIPALLIIVAAGWAVTLSRALAAR